MPNRHLVPQLLAEELSEASAKAVEKPQAGLEGTISPTRFYKAIRADR